MADANYQSVPLPKSIYFEQTAAPVKAEGSIAIASGQNAANGDTVTLDIDGEQQTWTYRTTPTASNVYDLAIGADAAASALILVNGWKRAQDELNLYPNVDFTNGGTGNRSAIVTYRLAGTIGNQGSSVAKTGTHLTATSLTGGVDGRYDTQINNSTGADFSLVLKDDGSIEFTDRNGRVQRAHSDNYQVRALFDGLIAQALDDYS